MKNSIKKIIATAMAATLVISAAPVAEFAGLELPIFSSAAEEVNRPKASISSENLRKDSQVVTLKFVSTEEIKGYYWGNNPNHSLNEYKEILPEKSEELTENAETTNASKAEIKTTATEIVKESGTYYLTAIDTQGNVSNTAEMTFYETIFARAYNVDPNIVITPAVKGCSIKLPVPTRTGRTFLGWNTEADGTGTEYEGLSEYVPTENGTLYAQWQLNVNSVEIENYPTKTSFHIGDEFDYQGLEIGVTFGNNTTKALSTDFTVSEPDMTVAGEKTVTVSYGGKSASYKITVSDHNYGTKWYSNSKSHWHVCSVCGEETAAVAHTAKSWTVTKKPTYYENGVKVKKCEVCSAVFATASIDKLVLGVPTDINVIISNPTSATITYSKIKDATGYKIYNRTNQELAISKTNSYTFTDLEPGKEYELYVRAYIGTKEQSANSDWSTAVKFTVPNVEALSVVTAPKITDYHVGDMFSASGLTLAMTYSNGHTEMIKSGFKLSKPDMTTAGKKTITVTYGGLKTSFVINVTAHKYKSEWVITQNYHWHECSICAEKKDVGKHVADGWKVTKKATYFENGKRVKVCKYCGKTFATETINKISLGIPTSVKVTPITPYTAKLTFAKVKDATGYQIFRSDLDEGFVTTGNSYIFTGLKPGESYMVLICAYLQSGKKVIYSGWSDLYEFANVPTAVKDVKATALSSSALKITWANYKGAAGYHVYNKTTGKSYLTTSNSYKISGLKAGTKYKIYVRAYYLNNGSRCYGKWAAAQNSVTKPATLTASLKSGSKKITVSYNGISGVTGYQIVYSTDSKFKNKKVIATSQKSKTISGLDPNKTYYVAVRAYIKSDSQNVYGNFSKIKSAKPTK